jgi:hypothetical protein
VAEWKVRHWELYNKIRYGKERKWKDNTLSFVLEDKTEERNMKIQDIGGDSTGQTYSVSSVTYLNMRKYKFAESHKTFLIFKVVEHEMSTQSCVLSHTHWMDSVCEKCNLFKKLSIYTVVWFTFNGICTQPE